MQNITLKSKYDGRISVEAEIITPDNFSGKDAKEIGEMDLFMGNKTVKLKDIFEVSVEGSSENPEDTEIIIKGNTDRIKRIGEGMTSGKIVIEGDVDMHCGAMMRGGKIIVKGDADSWAGREMSGGELLIEGDAKNYIGGAYRGETYGMTGGKITVKGNVGAYLGEKMKDGEIVVEGDADMISGMEMLGGKIIIKGDAIMPGGEMKGGTVIVMGEVTDRMPTFKMDGMEIIEGIEFNRYTGDLSVRRAKGVLYMKG
ncbi:MAG: Formylmethanofuran dehydrogenase subunit C [Candidatus Methanolliviera sp. GoM_asphalt]|nr:MAG: Formylmethanofuran dehydrogenase subunit C [Candidatus Methanolliviera sp. GoM_asphalt]